MNLRHAANTKCYFLFALFSISILTSSICIAESPNREESLRSLAREFATLFRKLSALQKNAEVATGEREQLVRNQIYEARQAALSLVHSADKFDTKESKMSYAESAAKIDTFYSPEYRREVKRSDLLATNIAISFISLSTLAGAVIGYHHGLTPSGPGSAIAGAAIGFLPGLFGGVLLDKHSGKLYLKLERLFLASRAADSEEFFDELKKEGIPIPDSNRKEWLTQVVASAGSELTIQNNPEILELKITHLNAAIHAISATLGTSTGEGAAIASLLEGLPKTKSWKRKLRPGKWAEDSYLGYLHVRNELARLCEKYGLEKRGYSFESEFQANLNSEVRSLSGNKLSQIISTEDKNTEKFLKKSEDTFLSSEVLKLYQSSESSIRITLKPSVREHTLKNVRPVAIAELTATLVYDLNRPPIEFNITFPTRIELIENQKLTQKQIDSIVEEGNWQQPLEAAMNSALESSPQIKDLAAQKIRVDVCQTQALPNAEQAHEVEVELAATQSQRASSH